MRPPKPTKLKLLEGIRKERINTNEPKPKSAKRVPPAPSYLPALAKKEWKRHAGELHRLGLLTDLDRPALEGYCHAYSTFMEAVKNIEKHGVLVKAQSGFPMQSPYLSIANKAMAEMRKWQTEFGMTPSSRSKITIQPDKQHGQGRGILKYLDDGSSLLT